jgi:hypothetical protein
MTPGTRSPSHRSIFPPVLRENRFLRFSVWAVLLGFLILGLLGGWIHAVVTSIREAQQKTFREPRTELLRQYDLLMRNLEETKSDRQLLPEVRPYVSELVSFIRSLEAAAAAAGVEQTITDAPAGKQKETDGGVATGTSYSTPVIRYAIELSGTMDGITSYLSALQRMPTLVRVESVTLTAEEGEDLLQHATARLQIAVAVREEQ